MARQRRGGFRPPEIRGTLGTLLRTTLAQAGTLRDAIERGAREGRSRLEDARANRRRNDAVAELGEIVLELIRNGEIDLDELPEVRALVRQLDELDASDPDRDDDDNDDLPRATERRRFDDRHPTRDMKPPRAGARSGDDGTVSSSTWKASRRASGERVWRPPAVTPAEEPRNRDDASTRAKTRAITPPRKGGITFAADDADDDLADYMHPDDVPPKPEPDDKS